MWGYFFLKNNLKMVYFMVILAYFNGYFLIILLKMVLKSLYIFNIEWRR